MSADFTGKALERSFYSLLFFAQAVGKQSLAGNLQLSIVSSNMQKVTRRRNRSAREGYSPGTM